MDIEKTEMASGIEAVSVFVYKFEKERWESLEI